MTELSGVIIFLHGQVSTNKILSIDKTSDGRYVVVFKSNPSKKFKYAIDNVKILTRFEYYDPNHSKIYHQGRQLVNVKSIKKFPALSLTYWKITNDNGMVLECPDSEIKIQKSCLGDKTAANIFKYLKNIASTNPLGTEENKSGILANIYAKIEFIDDRLAAACYLNPRTNKVKDLTPPNTILFPFGCNQSQKKAVTTALSKQISIIQGPPGTGKTQTILNLAANLITNGKTVLIVSSNNSAIDNIAEKLQKYGLSFFVAGLGKKENKESFIKNQPKIPEELSSWNLSTFEAYKLNRKTYRTLALIDELFTLQNRRAELNTTLQGLELEWQHFRADKTLSPIPKSIQVFSSEAALNLWQKTERIINEDEAEYQSFLGQIKKKMHLKALNFVSRKITNIKENDDAAFALLIEKFQQQYYARKQKEINKELFQIEKKLKSNNLDKELKNLTDNSMTLFKYALHQKYHKEKRTTISDLKEIEANTEAFIKQYPIVLSTTFSARSCLFGDKPYDYIIMDEASQISIETGFLATTCAYNAVIVGDTYQLPNVVTNEDEQKMNAIIREHKIPKPYDCAKHSFLESVTMVIDDVPQTLLREHYRCHPRIINFCNQQFYNGELIIMTKDKGEDNVLSVVRTAPGNHAHEHINYREVEVIKQEVLPLMPSTNDVGAISPFVNQTIEIKKQIDYIEADTVHKFQGREKQAIIFSATDNQISEFTDNANLLNVAVSRAKEQFVLVVSGNEQARKGNIAALIDYINYNNGRIIDSNIASVYDYLYTQYTQKRVELLNRHPKISKYDSENLTYLLLKDILAKDLNYRGLHLLCQCKLYDIFRDMNLMSDEERQYARRPGASVDFLIINVASKRPLLAVEVDGYSFHTQSSALIEGQKHRDRMKDHIFQLYGIKLLRLNTKGSNERSKVCKSLDGLLSIPRQQKS